MGNLLGAAFGFGARDVGLKAATTSITKDLDRINGLLDDQDKKGGLLNKMWGKFRKRINEFNIASIASNTRQLVGETGNLSNSIESMAASYDQAARPVVASMNITGAEADKMVSKITGMAISLNTSADAVAETFKAIRAAGGPAKSAIDAMRMSHKDWVKVVQTTGVTMQDYSSMLGDLVASWGAAPDEAAAMVDNIMAIGKAAGVGTSAIKGAKAQLDALNVLFEGLPPSMARSSDEIIGLMESTYKLAGAFREMGATEESAVQAGQDTAKMFAQQSIEMEKMFQIGSEETLETLPLFKFMSMLGIGVDETRDVINEGSRDVVKGVSRINDIFERMGGQTSPQVQYALAELNKSMGQSTAGLGWLASNLDVGTKSLEAMSKMTVKGEGALKRYGDEAYRTGRTLQESFDLARESFDTQIRRISRKDVKELVNEQTKAYRRVGEEMRGLASDENWGPLVKTFSMFKQMGLKGLMLDLTKGMGKEAVKGATDMGVKMETILGAAQQLRGEIAPIMELFGPLGVVGAGVGAWFMMTDEQQEEIKKRFGKLFDWMGEAVSGVFDKLAKSETIDKIASNLGGILDKIVDWSNVGAKLIGGINWERVSLQIGAAIMKAFDKLFGNTPIGRMLQTEKAASNAERVLNISLNVEKFKNIKSGFIKERRSELASLDELFLGGGITEEEWEDRSQAMQQGIDRVVGLTFKEFSDDVINGGKNLAQILSDTFIGESDVMKEGMSKALSNSVSSQLPHSDPEEGPLAGSFLRDSGYEMLMMIGDGMKMAEEDFRTMFSQILDDSVMTTLDEYDAKVKEWTTKKSLIKSVAEQMAKEFGGGLNFGTVKADNVNINSKEIFEKSIEVPGLSGVIAAITANGHANRVLLKKIWEDTHYMAGRMSNSNGRTGAMVPVLP